MKRISESSKITLTLGQIIRLVNECRYVLENKDRLIDKASISDDEKAELKNIFRKYNHLEKEIDWNKPDKLTIKDFDVVFNKVKKLQARKQEKVEIASDAKNIFKSVGDRKFKYIGENNDWLFVAPLTHEAAVYCDSSENQGGGAKWCIGEIDNRRYWDRYISEDSTFIMAFNKKYKELSSEEKQIKLKYMIQQDKNHRYHLWPQDDREISWNPEKFGETNKKFDQMFKVAKKGLKEAKEQHAQEANERVNELIQGLTEIDEYTIPEDYKRVVTKIVIPDSVTSIGDSAFLACLSLKLIDIPNSVTSIEDSAFGYCSSLQSFDIPNSVTSIGRGTFWCCKNLKSVLIPDSVTSIGEYAFYDCESLKSIDIPDSVTNIEKYAFSKCSSLKSVVIPKSVTSIGERAFIDCSSLESVVIPDSVTNIGKYAFFDCESLRSVVIPGSVTSIGDDAFPKGCEVIRRSR